MRIARTCRRLGIRSIGVYSEADRQALHVRVMDEAHPIGPAPASLSYLSTDAIVRVARESGAEAIHPGYGFLAENPAFAARCQAAGLAFVGPPPEAMRLLGDKAAARRLAAAEGIPLMPGASGESSALAARAGELGFPLMVKAAAGGGGRGMRVVREHQELAEALESASREALAAFGDGRLILERYLERARHVEVQVLADAHGAVLALGERDCSVQRRHQKVVEEAPAPGLSPHQRERLAEAACRLARAGGYGNAGTVEFLLAPDGAFSFIEVNTRLQVEHPVTEAVTGLDLVELQLRVAAGEPLGLTQDDVRVDGHAIECRVYAEDPSRDHLPSSGWLTAFQPPELAGVRNDVGVEEGAQVQSFYDPLLAKLVVHAGDRPAALALLREALARYRVGGLPTNLPQLRALAALPEFQRAKLWTDLLGERGVVEELPPEIALAAAALYDLLAPADTANPWTSAGPWRPLRQAMPLRYECGGRRFTVLATAPLDEQEAWELRIDEGGAQPPRILALQARLVDDHLALRGEQATCEARLERVPGALLVRLAGRVYRLDVDRAPRPAQAGGRRSVEDGRLGVEAPLPGRLVALPVSEGTAVEPHQTVAVLEAMKMEHAIRAPRAGVVARLPCAVGSQVARGQVLVELLATSD